jgi:hypothetical protein
MLAGRTSRRVAVADIQAEVGAKQPNAFLQQAREVRRAIGTELARIDFAGSSLDDGGTAVWRVARRSIGVLSP